MLSHKWDLPDSEGIPQVPRDLTSVSDKEIMDLFATLVAWQNYVDQSTVDLEQVEAMKANALKVAEAFAMARSGAKQVAQQKAEMLSDPLVQERSTEYLTAKSNRKALGIQKEALERTTNLVSRELSRRIGRGPTESRNARFKP